MEDTRTIIPIEAEEKTESQRSEREKDLAFLAQWKTLDDYPACPIGITLMRCFAEAAPELWYQFVERNPSGHQSVPAVLRHPKWVEYKVHWGTCNYCMEA
jgi:hypothetical protein